MLMKILIAAGAVCAVGLLCWLLRGAVLMPVKPGRNVRLRILLTVYGAAPTLEQTVDALLWLRANGTLPGEIILSDRGMDPETAAVAAALEKSGAIKIMN